MAVYNYFRARWLDGEAPIDDGPPPITAAIEDWLGSWGPFRAREPIVLRVVSEERVTLLALRHRSTSPEEPQPLELVHVIAVTERRLSDAGTRALRGVFESLYGRPLDASLSRLEATLARLPQAMAATRVLGYFATEEHLKRLPWLGFDAPDAQPHDPRESETMLRTIWRERTPLQVTIALGLLVSGLLVGNLLPRLPFASSDGAKSEPGRVAELRGEVARLASALEEHEWVHRRELEEQRRAREVSLLRDETDPAPAAKQAPAPAAERPAARPKLATKPAPPDVAPPPPTRLAPPPVAAPPPTKPTHAPARRFQVAVKTARVRAGPSAEERVRGLLARYDPVRVTGQRGDWLEIEPPSGFRPPTWIHRRLVRATE